MKITKTQLKQIIKEELEEGFMDKITGMLGSKKEELPMSDKIAAVRRMFLDTGSPDDVDDKLNNAMEALDALKLKDEVGEDGSIGKKLWDARNRNYETNKITTKADYQGRNRQSNGSPRGQG